MLPKDHRSLFRKRKTQGRRYPKPFLKRRRLLRSARSRTTRPVTKRPRLQDLQPNMTPPRCWIRKKLQCRRTRRAIFPGKLPPKKETVRDRPLTICRRNALPKRCSPKIKLYRSPLTNSRMRLLQKSICRKQCPHRRKLRCCLSQAGLLKILKKAPPCLWERQRRRRKRQKTRQKKRQPKRTHPHRWIACRPNCSQTVYPQAALISTQSLRWSLMITMITTMKMMRTVYPLSSERARSIFPIRTKSF